MGFSVQRWAAWAPGLVNPASWETWLATPHPLPADGTPALSAMPAMMRRRVDRLGRIALQTAYDAHVDAPDAPVLFASRYGDLARSVELLTQLARSEPLSPTSFSLSVHNAIGALYSIARGDTSSYSAIAAGEETVEAAFTEACGLLSDGVPRVMVVVYDEPVPTPWEHFSRDVAFPHAWACLLSASTGPDAIHLGCATTPSDAPVTRQEPDALPADLRALRFLVSGASRWEHAAGARRWRWERHA
ncbi:beta-ketoacyl synthase chain length factor [Corallococcus macrosporus]|uniref:Beta-ketoacyl synthase chain length factor n=2 Tax=Corallococcus macrosporus TaxID=35 RepID=A0ABS3D4N7_9BACT|nr:beta-ketoacyl synthase chain length factor [Corallococcus macrosporus]MBN8226623.1 beta-ketoacyl synthase chain length factor [Corallococcus macrosporus]